MVWRHAVVLWGDISRSGCEVTSSMVLWCDFSLVLRFDLIGRCSGVTSFFGFVILGHLVALWRDVIHWCCAVTSYSSVGV